MMGVAWVHPFGVVKSYACTPCTPCKRSWRVTQSSFFRTGGFSRLHKGQRRVYVPKKGAVRNVVVCNSSNTESETESAALVESEEWDAEILALGETWVAVQKPAGILVHRTKLYHASQGESYLVDVVRREVERRVGRPATIFPVQRLDRPTSGVILFALDSSENASRLQSSLQSEEARKEYWTLVFGADMPVTWVNNHALRDLTGRARKQRPASSAFKQLLRLDESDMSVVRAQIATGRRHQIRRHLSNSRYPVVGDTSHGKGPLNRKAREHFGITRCCLHSRRVSFKDPLTLDVISIEAPVPQDLRDVLERLPDYNPLLHESRVDIGDLRS